jgi:DNA-binding transcriptional MocR family regulator
LKFRVTDKALMVELSPVEEVSRIARQARVINFASGNPDLKLIPVHDVVGLVESVVAKWGVKPFTYPGMGGIEDLKAEIKRFTERIGVDVDGDDVVVTCGAQHAFRILSDVLVDHDVTVFCENPTFYEVLTPLRINAKNVVGVPIDSNGIVTYELEKLLKSFKSKYNILYLVPTCHNPTGVTMSIERRKHVLELASTYDLIILEDDPYRPIAGNTPPPLKSLDSEGRVIYVGSLSKVFAPGLRIGWIATSSELAYRIALFEQLDFATSTFTQYIALEALKSGFIYKYMLKLADHYRGKINTMLKALSDFMPYNVEWTKPYGGFFLMLTAQGFDAELSLTEAIRSGVIYVPTRKFYVNDERRNTLRLSITQPTAEEIIKGVEILSQIIRRQ